MNKGYYQFVYYQSFVIWLFIISLLLVSTSLFSQVHKFQKFELDLIDQYQIIRSLGNDTSADSIKNLFRNNILVALNDTNSFQYPFDSLKKLLYITKSDDNSLRLFSLNNENIQINIIQHFNKIRVKSFIYQVQDTTDEIETLPHITKVFSLGNYRDYIFFGMDMTLNTPYYVIEHIRIDGDCLVRKGFYDISEYFPHPLLYTINNGLVIYCNIIDWMTAYFENPNKDSIPDNAIDIRYNKNEKILSFNEYHNPFTDPWEYYSKDIVDPYLKTKFSIDATGERTRIMLDDLINEKDFHFSQIDTIILNKFINRAKYLYSINEKDSSFIYLTKTLNCYKSLKMWEKYFSTINIFSKKILDSKEITTALFLSNQAVQNSIELFGDQNKYLPELVKTIGDCQFKQKLFLDALDTFLKALKMSDYIFGSENLCTASIYESLGKTYQRMFDFELGKQNYLMSLQIKEGLCEESSYEIISALQNLGIIYRQNGETTKALNFLIRSLDIYSKFNLKKDGEYACLLIDLGLTYINRNEYNLAKEYFENGYNILKNQVEKPPEVLEYLMNMGEGYETMGYYYDALNFYNEVITYNKELFTILGPDHKGNIFKNAEYINLFARIYSKIGKYDLALQYLRMIDEYKSDKNDRIEENRNLNYGFIYRKLNKIDSAINYYESALSFAHRDLQKKHPSISNYYNILGDLYLEKNELESSQFCYNEAVISNIISKQDTVFDFHKKITDYYNPLLLLQSFDGEAKILHLKYQKTKDFKILSSILKIYEICDTLITNIRKSYISQSDKIALGEISSRIYENAINTCLALEALQKSNQKIYLSQALLLSEKNKSGVLLESMEANKALHFSGIPDSLITLESTLREQISNFRNVLQENRDSIANLKLQSTLFELSRQYEKLFSLLETNYPNYYDLKFSVRPLNIANLKKSLNKHTAIVSYLVGDSIIYAFTLTYNTLRVSLIENSDSILVSVNEIQKFLKKSYGTKIDGTFKVCSYYLFNKLLQKNIFKETNNLIIIPDGQLMNIPFEVLFTENIDKNIDYKYAPFLIRKCNISYSYSMNLLYKYQYDISDPILNNYYENDWLGIAPVFDGVDTNNVTLSTKTTLEYIDKLTSRTLLIRNGYISPLPGTEKEITTIFGDFNKKKMMAKALLFNSATEEELKMEFRHPIKYVHIATHAWVNSEKPELSGILLSQRKNSYEDGILYSGEIYNLKINSDLIVLSACETGVGKFIKGEGLLGLSRSLLYAGCKNLIVSLWKVEDNSTSILMIDFYNAIINSKKKFSNYSESLRYSKLKMIDSDKYSNPFYWAPFILIGK